MSLKSEKETTETFVVAHPVDDRGDHSLGHADDVRLAELGYKSEFKREFSVRGIRRMRYRSHGSTLLDDRVNCFFFLHYGCRFICFIDFFFPAGIGGSCGHDLWLAHPLPFCHGRCCVYCGDGFVHAVSMQFLHSGIQLTFTTTKNECWPILFCCSTGSPEVCSSC